MIKEYPLVTVAVLTYQKFDGIFQTLDSIFMQKYPRIELIIADDGSPGYGKYIGRIQDYINRYKGSGIVSVIYLHQDSNLGTVKNCNYAIKKANGKYMKFLSPEDEFYDPYVLQKCAVFAEKNGSAIVAGQTLHKSRDGSWADPVIDSPAYRWKARGGRKCTLVPSSADLLRLKRMSPLKRRYLLMTQPVISTVSVFFSMALLRRTGGFLEEYRLIEDMTYWPYLAKKGIDFDFVKIIMVKYALTGVSNGGEHRQEFEKDRREIIRKYYISNMASDSPGSRLKKNERKREADYLDRLDQADKKASVLIRIKYLDVLSVFFLRNMKYLLLGSRI